jgi:hypothetical protein
MPEEHILEKKALTSWNVSPNLPEGLFGFVLYLGGPSAFASRFGWRFRSATAVENRAKVSISSDSL